MKLILSIFAVIAAVAADAGSAPYNYPPPTGGPALIPTSTPVSASRVASAVSLSTPNSGQIQYVRRTASVSAQAPAPAPAPVHHAPTPVHRAPVSVSHRRVATIASQQVPAPAPLHHAPAPVPVSHHRAAPAVSQPAPTPDSAVVQQEVPAQQPNYEYVPPAAPVSVNNEVVDSEPAHELHDDGYVYKNPVEERRRAKRKYRLRYRTYRY